MPLESRRSRLLAGGCTLALVAWLAVACARPAVAWYLAREDTIPSLERALAWTPADATLHTRLGYAYATLVPPDATRARAHYDAAMRLRPTDSAPRLLAALLASQAGTAGEARRLIEEALRLDPHNVTVRWEAALLFMGWGAREEAVRHFRYVLANDPAQRDAAFYLARTLLAPGEDPASLLPDDPIRLTGVLFAALRHGDLALAETAWSRRMALDPPRSEDIPKRYMRALLQSGDGQAARRAWRTFASAARDDPGNAVWNGGFEVERLLGWGLDWRIRKVWGVDVALDRFVAAAGSRSLRFAFNALPKLDFSAVTQFVPVEPGREYVLRALARASDFVTRSGLKLQVVVPGTAEQLLAETPAVSGTTPAWVPLDARVRIPPGVSLVVLRVRREPALEPEGNLGGKVWLDEVRLQ